MSSPLPADAPDHPALRSALITYLGNKRALLPFIWEGVRAVHDEIGPIHSVADPFHGSGVVSRLARLAGWTVIAGDIEDYARPFGTAFLTVDQADIPELFAPFGGYEAVLADLNSRTAPPTGREYFSRHYAPRDTATADPARERLFFTRENARRIDAMVAGIHEEYGAADPRVRDVLLASLLVEMSVHNNTSGVMKGFHHGWGGRGGDALGRIMAPVMLEPLPFLTGPRGRMVVGPADRLPHPAEGTPFDLAYLDPPYTIHQYGANYHLLTSAVRYDFWDPGPVVHGRRAGIREDHYRSDHCRRSGDRARAALAAVVDHLDARALLVSYNVDGIVPPEAMLELLGGEGRHTVRLMSRRYHKFRGGKATQAAVRTREFLFVVIRNRRQQPADRDRLMRRIEQMVAERDLTSRHLMPDRLESVQTHRADGWELTGPDGETVQLDDELRVRAVTVPDDAAGARRARKRIAAATGSPVEAAETLLAIGDYAAVLRVLQRLKIAKYRADFVRVADRLMAAPLSPPERQRLDRLMNRVLDRG